ncbi:MAG: hypothetical protein MJY74_03240 [Bacteroidaceae bacterium]|nr:hypothetical protein [Bacteroidaceae bacterium]
MTNSDIPELLEKYIRSWQSLDRNSAEELRGIVERNPDSLPARVLLAYNLHKIGSDAFAVELENAVSMLAGQMQSSLSSEKVKAKRAPVGDYMRAFFDSDSDQDKPIFDISKLKADLEGLDELSAPTPKQEEKKPEPVFFSEPLAHIYIKQQKYDKALEIIRALSLNNPQKSCYFADQIRFLEEIIFLKQKNNK